MGKKLSRDDMMTLDARLDQQDKALNEILLCLKGSEAMNIEGVIPAQKRIEKKLDKEIELLNTWKNGIQKYFDVISSKGFRWFMLCILIAFGGMFLYLKFGWSAIVKYLTWLFS